MKLKIWNFRFHTRGIVLKFIRNYRCLILAFLSINVSYSNSYSFPSFLWFELAPLFLMLFQRLAVHSFSTIALYKLVVGAPKLIDVNQIFHLISFQFFQQIILVLGEHVPTSCKFAFTLLRAKEASVHLISLIFLFDFLSFFGLFDSTRGLFWIFHI